VSKAISVFEVEQTVWSFVKVGGVYYVTDMELRNSEKLRWTNKANRTRALDFRVVGG
jgi:hypothetical protein